MSLLSKNDKVEILNDIVVPAKFYKRIDLGKPILNEVFGGQEMPGILPGESILFTGTPGAGKSTMALQLADLMAKSGLNVLYNVGEENRYMVKMRADRLGLEKKFCISQFEEVSELIKYCDDNGVEVLFQDSLQSLTDGDAEGNAKLKSACKKLVAWKELSDVTQFIIGHVTKGGIFAGPNELKHDVDVHAHLRNDPDSGNRVFELTKNRNGPACIPYEFSISAAGLDFQQVNVIDSETEGASVQVSRTADRREKIKNLIKEKLVAGEKISGYCFERFEVDCSGGFWRGMLARACRELQSEGNVIDEVRIDGRLHNYVKEK